MAAHFTPIFATPTPIQVERRFPLHLHEDDTPIRQLYETAKQSRWNPESTLSWGRHGLDQVSPAAREAARRVWSRRAWVEYTGMAETPALLIRFCLELNRESDPKYFLTVRNTEEAWHIECFHRYAEACGGYIDRPSHPGWEPVFNRTQYRDALNAGVSIDAYVAVHCAFVDGLELLLAQAWAAQVTEPLAKSMLAQCLKDYERHAQFGWLYAKRRAVTMSDEVREHVAQGLKRHIEDVEFAGYHCVGLASQLDASAEVADLQTMSAAGLGAVTAEQEVEIFRECLSRTRRGFADWGLNLPHMEHRRWGTF